MSATAAPPLEWAHGVAEVARLGDRFVEERFVDGWFYERFDGCHDAALAAAPELSDQVAVGDELSLVASLERTIRWAQAEQYRLIESARARHACIEGVAEASTAGQRELATRSFVAELATTLVVPEPLAGRLVADAGRLTGPRSATLDALAAGEVAIGAVDARDHADPAARCCRRG